MKIPSRQLEVGQVLFNGDAAGGDELLLIADPVPTGATAILSAGFDYGSSLHVYRVTEDQYQAIIGDEPPFGTSYEARLWLGENAEECKGKV